MGPSEIASVSPEDIKVLTFGLGACTLEEARVKGPLGRFLP